MSNQTPPQPGQPPPPLPPMFPAPSNAAPASTSAAMHTPITSTGTRDTSTPNTKIDKLSDGNYTPWKRRVSNILGIKGAWEIANGSVLKPAHDAVAIKNWNDMDQIAQNIIMTTIKNNQMTYLSDCSTAAEMWEALGAVHEPKGYESIKHERHLLNNTYADDTTDISAHINQLREIRERLAAAGLLVSEDDFKYTLLCSLPHSWDAYVISFLGSQNAMNITVHALITRLKDEYRRRKDRNTDDLAYPVNPTAPKFKPRKCAICGRNNHVTANCRFKGKPKCGICGKFGHKDDDCWKNPHNKGKGRVSTGRDNSIGSPAPNMKGKARAHVTKDDSDSDTTELAHNFIAHVSIDDDCQMKAAEGAELCAYSAWIADSGATTHICADRTAFADYATLSKKVVKGLGNHPVTAYGKGTIVLICRVGNRDNRIRLSDVLYVPDARENLLSLGRIDAAGGRTMCANQTIYIYNPQHQLIATGHLRDHLYYLQGRIDRPDLTHVAKTINHPCTWADWHRRLGHISITGLRTLHGKNLVDGFSIADSPQDIDCPACIASKHTREPIPKTVHHWAKSPGELTHTDVWGPARVPTHKGYKYYISFIDDATRYTTVRFLKTKDEAAHLVKQYLAWLERQHQLLPKAVCADNGREYINRDLQTWCLDRGIELQTTAPHTPEQNGVAERWNRTVVELSRAMLFAHNLPTELWADSITHATYIRNRAFTRSVPDMTPYQKWHQERPDISHIREFGCIVWVLREELSVSKLAPQSKPFTFVGFEDGPKAIRYYDVHNRNVKVSRNYKWASDPPAHRLEGEQGVLHKPLSDVSDAQPNNEQNQDLKRKEHDNDISHNKNKRARINEIPDLIESDNDDEDDTPITSAEAIYNAFSETGLGGQDPKTLQEAKNSPDWPQWEKAIQIELDTLNQMGTWEIVDAPEGRKPITNKWVFVRKYDKDGNLQKYKARLVARGFSQVPGMDFNETFSPVVRLETIRAILALAVAEDWEIQQMDVKGAYLHGTLKEEIYMDQPDGYSDGTSRLCRLIKTIYGLKQSGREWNEELDMKLLTANFSRLYSDPCVYIRQSEGSIEIITVWVDDMLLFTNSKERMDALKQELRTLFDITDLGEPSKLVGLEITRDRPNGTLTIKQTKYIESLLQKYGLQDANPVTIPMDPTLKLESAPITTSDTNWNYASLTGSLMYAVIGTRPDITYAVNKLCSFTSNPDLEHWTAAKRILRYLKGTKDLGITYMKSDPNEEFHGYADASLGNNYDMTSTSGNVFLLHNGAITWSSKKQKVVATSTTESEFISMVQATRQVVWLRNLYTELGYEPTKATTLYADNRSAIAIATDGKFHQRTTHFKLKYLRTRQHIQDGTVNVTDCRTDDMTADIFTKALDRAKHQQFTRTLGLR